MYSLCTQYYQVKTQTPHTTRHQKQTCKFVPFCRRPGFDPGLFHYNCEQFLLHKLSAFWHTMIG